MQLFYEVFFFNFSPLENATFLTRFLKISHLSKMQLFFFLKSLTLYNLPLYFKICYFNLQIKILTKCVIPCKKSWWSRTAVNLKDDKTADMKWDFEKWRLVCYLLTGNMKFTIFQISNIQTSFFFLFHSDEIDLFQIKNMQISYQKLIFCHN